MEPPRVRRTIPGPLAFLIAAGIAWWLLDPYLWAAFNGGINSMIPPPPWPGRGDLVTRWWLRLLAGIFVAWLAVHIGRQHD